MTHTVFLLPGSVQCGKCGRAMRHENEPFDIGKPVHMACWDSRCEMYDVPVVIPIRAIEVEKVEA